MPRSSMLIEEELTRRAARTERRLRKLEAADRPASSGATGLRWYNAMAYGAIADGSSHPLSDYYADLSSAQAVYPHAISLTDELDWAAIQAAINACGTTGGRVYCPAGTYIINRPILLPAGSISFVGADKSRTIIKKTANDVGVGTARTFRSGTVTDNYPATDAVLMIDHANETYARYVTIEDVYLYDDAPSPVAYIIYAPRIAYITIERVRTYGGSTAILTKSLFIAEFDHVICKGLSSSSGYAFRLTNDSGWSGGTSTKFLNCYADTWRYGYYCYGVNYSGWDTCAADNIGTAGTKGVAYWAYLCQGAAMVNCGAEVVYGTVIAVDNGHFSCIGFRADNINGTTAPGNAYLEIGRNSVNTRATFIGCYFEPFTTPNAGLNLICTNTAHLVYINTTEPRGGNTFLALSGDIYRITNGNLDTTENLLPQGYLLRDKATTVKAHAVRCGQAVGVKADTYTSLMTFSTTDGQFSAYRGVFTGLLTVSGHMRTSGGSARFIAGVWLITIYKWANYNLALMSTPLGSHNTGLGGEAIAIRSAEATATSLVIQAKINCTNFDSGSIVWGLRGECGSTEAASMIALSEEAEEIVEPDPPDPPPPPPPPAGLVPGHYRMLDAGAPDRELATALFYWSEVNPSAGVYNWDIVDSWLALHPDGIIQIFFHVSGVDRNNNFFVYLPSDVDYYTIASGSQYARIPKYDSSTFRARYIQFIQAFGARYDGQPVIACLGLDGESQCAKTQSGIDWVAACYGTDANAVPYRFVNNFIPEILQAYAAAFPNSVVFANCAPGGTDGRMKVYQQAVSLGLGLKSSGLVSDTDSWHGYDTGKNPPTHDGVLNGTYTGLLGIWDIIKLGMEQGLVICTESAYGYSDDPLKALRAGLMYHPTAMCWHQEWLNNTLLTQAQLDWAEGYLGVTKATTPGVWWARHVTAFPITQVGGSGYYSGHGHCEFWLSWDEDDTWTVDGGVTITNPTILIQYTGTGTMTVNGTTYALGAGGELEQAVSGEVTTVVVTGATVTFLELRK